MFSWGIILSHFLVTCTLHNLINLFFLQLSKIYNIQLIYGKCCCEFKTKKTKKKTKKKFVFSIVWNFFKGYFSEQKINTLIYCFVFTPFIAKPKVKTQVISLKMFQGLTKVSISLDWTQSWAGHIQPIRVLWQGDAQWEA